MIDFKGEDPNHEESLYEYEGLLTCSYCKVDNLHWENFGTLQHPIWRLADSDCIEHICDPANLEMEVILP